MIIDEDGVACIISAAYYVKFGAHLTIQQARNEVFRIVHHGVVPYPYVTEYVRDRIEHLREKDAAQFYMNEVCNRK